MRLLIIGLSFCFAGMVSANGKDTHTLFTDLLRDYVNDGVVNYRDMDSDSRLQTYLNQLANTDPDSLVERAEQMAFWLNAYNAFTLKIILDNYPVKSINDLHWGGLYLGTVLKKTIWHKKFITIAGQEYSLNNIEHDILRARYEDPRVHFALVCASISCPPLRCEAYEADRLDDQLNDQAHIFFADTTKSHFDSEKKRAYLSKILDWFKGDFGENNEEILVYAAQYLPAELAHDIKQDPQSWKIKHTKYDWSLNGY